MNVSLHLGAHKTATTYIQNALALSNEQLSVQLIGCPSLDRVRSTMTRRLDWGGLGLRAAASRLLDEYRGFNTVILSDENIMGGLRPSFGTRTLYQRCESRVGALLRGLEPHPVRVLFAVRSYDEFASALYCEFIRHNAFVDAETYLSRLNLPAFSWLDVVAALAKVASEDSITLWRYEDFALLEYEVFDALTDGHADIISKTRERLRESLSAAAVQEVSRLPSIRSVSDRRSRVKQISLALPKGPQRPAFSAFEPSEAAELRARYREDVAAIAARFPQMRLLHPHGRSGTTSLQDQ